MAGTIDVLQRGYTAREVRGDVLYLNPHLPQELTNLHLDLRYCGHSLVLDITQDDMRVDASPSAARAITISVNDTLHRLDAGESKVFRRGGILVNRHGGK